MVCAYVVIREVAHLLAEKVVSLDVLEINGEKSSKPSPNPFKSEVRFVTDVISDDVSPTQSPLSVNGRALNLVLVVDSGDLCSFVRTVSNNISPAFTETFSLSVRDLFISPFVNPLHSRSKLCVRFRSYVEIAIIMHMSFKSIGYIISMQRESLKAVCHANTVLLIVT